MSLDLTDDCRHIRRISVGNTIVDHSDVLVILDLTLGYNGLEEGNGKARQGTFGFWIGATNVRGFTFVQVICKA